MKKILAAALSIIVGAFGYTIVDKALENRVTNLESEIVELQAEVSKRHPQANPSSTTSESSDPSTRPTSKSNFYPEKKIDKSEQSKVKFLLRVYDNGIINYISPEEYGKSLTQPKTENETKINRDYISNDYTTILTTAPKALQSTSRTSDNPEIISKKAEESTKGIVVPKGDYFLLLTESSAQVESVDNIEEYSYYCNKDYSVISQQVESQKVTIVIKYKGYTDPAFAGCKVRFLIDLKTSCGTISDSFYNGWIFTGNTINSDGSFECSEIITLDSKKYPLIFADGLSYCVDSVNISVR